MQSVEQRSVEQRSAEQQHLRQQLNSIETSRKTKRYPFWNRPVDRAGNGPSVRTPQLYPALPKALFPQALFKKKRDRSQRLQQAAVGLGVALSMSVAGMVAIGHHRYSDHQLNNIPLLTDSITTDSVEGQTWTGENISFSQVQGNQFDVSFNLSHGSASQNTTTESKTIEHTTIPLTLRDIDLTLMMPEVPKTARNNKSLTRWFLTEREFNRQRVIFEPGSAHIDLPEGLEGYSADEVSIALTNNCLGAGYWELAVSVVGENGNLEKIYQGYFTFPRGAYAEIVSWLNPTNYWQQARTMEAWPGFRFLAGTPFALDELRTVEAETIVPVTDLKTEAILATGEQIQKENLIVYANQTEADSIQTWADLRAADLKFQSFVTPGIYDESRLWESDFSQLATVDRAVGRQITSELSEQPLIEIEIGFKSEADELRRLVISGINWEQLPKLESMDYSEGVYMPLGFGTPFTQNYDELEANPPSLSPFFSVVLDANNQVIDYRKDIGINGLVMHKDIDAPNLIHIYPMSYERITLIGHYVIDLNMYAPPSADIQT